MHSPIRRRCTSESFALPDQLILSIVLVGDEGRPLGDLNYIPIVIVGIGISVVVAVLMRG